MEALIEWFEGLGPVLSASRGHIVYVGDDGGGGALVFPFKSMNRRLFDGMLGFTGV